MRRRGCINAVRITLDLDDDVVSAARGLAAAERRSLGAVVSELARRGLTHVLGWRTRTCRRRWGTVR